MRGRAAALIFCAKAHGKRKTCPAPDGRADLRQGAAVEYVSCEPTESARELFDEDCEPVEDEQ